MFRLVMQGRDWDALDAQFRAAGRQESGGFLLARLGSGHESYRLLAHEAILPSDADWETANEDQLRPSGRSLSGAMGAAIETNSSLIFIHSHPDPRHPPSLSPLDRATSREWRAAVCGSTNQPFASIVWSPQGLAGEVFRNAEDEGGPISRFEIHSAAKVALQVRSAVRTHSDRDDRQVRALGAMAAERLRLLRIGVVGAGGTGSMVVELLARLGVARITVVDHDRIDEPSNLRRVAGSRPSDVEVQAPKVSVAARNVQDLGLGSKVDALLARVEEAEPQKQLIDCDVVINTTDTHASRAVVNQLSYQFGLPAIDVGLRVGTGPAGGVTGMPVEVRSLTSDSGCLWCRSVLNADRIREELLPPAERERLAAEGYVQGLRGAQPSLAPLNGIAASAAVLAAVRLFDSDSFSSVGYLFDPWEQYLQDIEAAINPDCVCQQWRLLGDTLPLPSLPTAT